MVVCARPCSLGWPGRGDAGAFIPARIGVSPLSTRSPLRFAPTTPNSFRREVPRADAPALPRRAVCARRVRSPPRARQDRLRRRFGAVVRAPAIRLRTARPRYAACREGRRLDRDNDEGARRHGGRAAVDAPHRGRQGPAVAQHPRALPPVGDAANPLRHALGHVRSPTPTLGTGTPIPGANDGAAGVVFIAPATC